MNKIIELTKDNIARLSNAEPFLLPDKLTLEFRSIGYDLSNAFITIKNGIKKHKVPLSSPIDIPEDLLFAGNLIMCVDAYLSGKLLKHWEILPIRIIETEDTLIGFDILSKIEKEIEELKNNTSTKEDYKKIVDKINEIIDKQNEITETVSEIKENYVAETKNI